MKAKKVKKATIPRFRGPFFAQEPSCGNLNELYRTLCEEKDLDIFDLEFPKDMAPNRESPFSTRNGFRWKCALYFPVGKKGGVKVLFPYLSDNDGEKGGKLERSIAAYTRGINTSMFNFVLGMVHASLLHWKISHQEE